MDEKLAPFIALVVDDEALVREVTGMMLEEHGATVIFASNGEEAITHYQTDHRAIELVFLDFSMPGKNGFETYTELRKIDPDAAFVMASGLSITPEVSQAQRNGEIEFLEKPFNEDELLLVVKRAFQRRGRKPASSQ